MNDPITTLDYHLWQCAGLITCLLIASICLSINQQAIRENRAVQAALLCTKRKLWLQDRGAPTLGKLPDSEFWQKPMSPRRRRERRMIRFKATLARCILFVMGEPTTPPLQTTVQKGGRRNE